ncbi:MAG TPA: hypothetical protein VFO76_03370 [Candidatus Kapabacteria bacterium]|nr:hypothetical protein [Candidatus Kapabacteria bacterium]
MLNHSYALVIRLLIVLLFSVATDKLLAQPSGQLRLPPSLERELKLRGKSAPRVIRFSDTVKADKLISQSIRDTSGEELDSTMVHDSAIVVIDSAVSLSHKEWLDSMLAELPETERTAEGLRFHYPDEMMVNTTRKQVPFDESLPMKMDPVSKEDLPLFGSLPMQRPIAPKEPPRFSFTAGGGTPYLPQLSAKALLLNQSQSTLEASGAFTERLSDVSAIKQQWGIVLDGLFLLNPPVESDPKPSISGRLSASSLSRDIADTTASAYSLFRTNLGLSIKLGTLEAIKLTSTGKLTFFNDNVATGISERSGKISLLLEKQATDSTNRLSFAVDYDGASTTTNKLAGNAPLGAATVEAAISSNTLHSFYWKAGVSAILTSDISGSAVHVFPAITLDERLSQEWSVFAGVHQSASVRSFDELFAENPFYTPLLTLSNDGRRITIDKYMITAGTEYFLTPVDRVHFAVEYGQRQNDISFAAFAPSLPIVRYVTDTFDTKLLSLSLDGALLFFANDRLTFSLNYTSTRSVADNLQLPYAPIAMCEASYSFGSLSDSFFPSVGIKQLSRDNKSLFFVNAAATYKLNPSWSLNGSINNILDTDGAYWDTYNEYPRMIILSVTGSF